MSHTKEDFLPINVKALTNNEQIRPSITFWADVWRRFKKNKLALIGLVGVIIVSLFGIFGPYVTPYSYSYQQTDYSNVPPTFPVYRVDENHYVFLTGQYRLLLISNEGEIVSRLLLTATDPINKIYTYRYNDESVIIDFSYRVVPSRMNLGIDYTVTYNNSTVSQPERTIHNKTFLLGSDNLGRDLLTRIMYGARISLSVALIATLVNLVIGVAYGSISAMSGGSTDNIMMRIVDIIDSIPLLIYVILLMVIINKPGSGYWTIILTLGTLYWVGMARLVRGQILGMKEQEFVLAARVLGVSNNRIIVRHMIPNTIGPIIVSLTMMIPTAVFTESFLSFIGLGVSAPQASWGTLANDAISNLQTYPYQLFFPSIAIAITMFAFNFLGDGLRTALDPRLRKG
ncbi:MAG: ABC transporter permease [Candidatus Izemoplasmatales bacterium]|nr:ABC transporter permease [bacterium]MDZ4195923.1 ABC transporter permease [Candidatus Izemoplasmatales bacterium]